MPRGSVIVEASRRIRDSRTVVVVVDSSCRAFSARPHMSYTAPVIMKQDAFVQHFIVCATLISKALGLAHANER